MGGMTFLAKVKQLNHSKSLKYLLHQHLSLYEPERSKKMVHASELTKDEELCPREYALNDLLKTKPVTHFLSTSENVTYTMGRMLQDIVVESFADPAQFRARLAEAGRGALGVALAGRGALYMIRLKDPAAIAAQAVPEPVRQLDVSILHALVLQPIFQLDPDAIKAGGNIEYTIDAEAALEAVASGSADGAFLINPPSIADVVRVSEAGATMPEKSTYFYPKLLTGLVMNPLFD